MCQTAHWTMRESKYDIKVNIAIKQQPHMSLQSPFIYNCADFKRYVWWSHWPCVTDFVFYTTCGLISSHAYGPWDCGTFT